MRKVIADAFRSQLEKRIPESFPAFDPATVPTSPTLGLFTSQVTDSHFQFVYFPTSSSRDEFTAEIAWNTTIEYPITLRPTRLTINDDGKATSDLATPSGRLRMCKLLRMNRDEFCSLQPKQSLTDRLANFTEFTNRVQAGTFEVKELEV